ncbi:MAG: restriction endonuclease subunit S, partial [Bacteroidales bacterium]
VYHYVNTSMYWDFVNTIKSAGAQPNINAKQYSGFEIPLPPLAEQERIVSILDKFDKLTNSISEGLPAEIKARQQQYEYYREKLLTFSMAAV